MERRRGGGCEAGAAVVRHDALLGVLLGAAEDGVHLGREQAHELHQGAQRQRDGERERAQRVTRADHVERHERQPQQRRRVVGEGDGARLVEAAGRLARLHRVHRRRRHQHQRVRQRHQVRMSRVQTLTHLSMSKNTNNFYVCRGILIFMKNNE